jgi:glycosyltransferase involved in cell wall biosynthesis
MKSFCSHTLVRNGMPFIDLVLRQVIPFANRCLVTISDKSTDGTLKVLRQLEKEFPNKVFIDFENVKSPGELTGERQKQVDKTYEDWILFLDDDDYWPKESLKEILLKIEASNEIDAYSVTPYQVIDEHHYDLNWHNKSFTKWFKNQKGINYRHPWPRDLIYLNDTLLYWKTNPRVPSLDKKFFHLSNIKSGSFRNEDWAVKFKDKIGTPHPIPESQMKHIWKIYEQFSK